MLLIITTNKSTICNETTNNRENHNNEKGSASTDGIYQEVDLLTVNNQEASVFNVTVILVTVSEKFLTGPKTSNINHISCSRVYA